MSTNDMVQIPREVLEKIQWQEHEDRSQTCCICSGVRNYVLNIGHKEDCPIGIALKQEKISEPVQHELILDGVMYRTVICDLSTACVTCDLYTQCRGHILSDKANLCMAHLNIDGKDRHWKMI